MMRIRRSRKLSLIGIFLLTIVMALSGISGAFAASAGGEGGNSYINPNDTNKFAKNLPLAEVWIDPDFFVDQVMKPVIDNGGGTSSNRTIHNPGGTNRVEFRNNKLKANQTNDFTNDNLTWHYTFENAATFADGSKGNVTVQFTVKTVEVGWYDHAEGTTIPCHATLTDGILQTGNNAGKGIHLRGFIDNPNGAQRWSYKAYIDATITVAGASGQSGDFIVGGTGANIAQNPSSPDTSAWYANKERSPEYTRESFELPDTNVYYPTSSQNQYDTTGGKVETYPTSNQGNRSYNSGFVTEGKSSGFTVKVGVIGGVNSGSSSQTNDMFIILGDLQHRIWSGSGPHGSINTYKNGNSGDEREGGEFTGSIPSGFPDDSDLRRYVVPDYKAGVKYTMTPDKGYTLDTIKVDNTSLSIPEAPTPGQTWTIASTDGDGTLTYVGGGKFTYTFDQPNTKDHEIYVTWKKETADIIVNKVWKDNSKASGVSANVKLVSDASPAYEDTKSVPTSDGLVNKWTQMPVYNYDGDGNATTAIKYTLSEVSDPVSSDYAKAVWDGADKESGTADGGFTLTDPSTDNKVRETNDPYTATVYNILKKDVTITKVWDDQSNKYGTRPSDIAGMFTLYNAGDDTEVTGVTPTATTSGNNTTVTWTGLPAYDTTGAAITYYAIETPPTGYTSDPANGKVSEGGSITNTLETVDVTITKVWDDNGDAKDKRPSSTSAMFKLYADAAEITNAPTPGETGTDTVTVTWEKVPKYNSAGDEIAYSAKETVPDQYKSDPADGIVAAGGTITNTFLEPPTGEDATSRNEKGVTQTGQPEFEKGTGEIPSEGAYTLLDKDGKPATTVTVEGQGTYTIDPDTGIVTFVPDPDFVGEASGVKVQVKDEYGLTATATYTPTVVDNERTKKITRTIKYTYITEDGKTAHADVVQTLRAVQHGHYDPDNPNADDDGMVWDDEWTYPDGMTFPAVSNPNIKGWKTDDVCGPYTITGPDDQPPVVHIVYQKDETPTEPSTPGKHSGSNGEKSTSTGDSARPFLFGGIMLLAAIAIIVTVARRRRHQ